MEGYIIRPWSEEDLTLIQQWAAEEKWSNSCVDIRSTFEVYNQDTFSVTQDGKLIGCCSAVRHGEDRGVIGFVILSKPWRGKGLGTKLLYLALEHLKDRSICLDAVLSAKTWYQKHGFIHEGQPVNVYKGQNGIRNYKPCSPGAVIDKHPSITDIAAYDALIYKHKVNRHDIWNCFLQSDIEIAICKNGSDVVGVAGIAECVSGAGCFKIGPLYAEDAGVAMDLCIALLKDNADVKSLMICTPQSNTEAVRFCEDQLELKVDYLSLFMYTDKMEDTSVSKVFGLLNPDLMDI